MVAFDEGELHGRGYEFGILDYAFSTLGVAAGEVDVLRRVLCESEDGLLAETIGS